MKSFIFKIFILFIILFFVDFVFGRLMSSIVDKIDAGGKGRDNYICNTSVDDVCIFGSSRAFHHYNPKIIEDSLGMSCYNCGIDGNGIILSYGRLLMILERHRPKIIINDVITTFDLCKNDNHKYLGWLKYRYERRGIKEIFDSIDKSERYKMISQMYRYNTSFLKNLVVYFTPVSPNNGYKGFLPLQEQFDPMKIRRTNINETVDIDSLKLEYIKKFIYLSKGSSLYFVVSPTWAGLDTTQFSPIRNICQEEGIPFFDFSNDNKYINNKDLFVDGSHLNYKGANEFTRDLIKIIKSNKEEK